METIGGNIMAKARCTTCNEEITPNERSVSFECPNCGEEVIHRCEKCRELGNQYECPNCGFVGP